MPKKQPASMPLFEYASSPVGDETSPTLNAEELKLLADFLDPDSTAAPLPPPVDYLTVSELTNAIQRKLSTDPVLGKPIKVRGELTNVKRSSRGHVYLTIKDEGASINGIIWASLMKNLPFDLEDGLEVDFTGNLEIYAPSGTYSLVAKKIEPVGTGALQLAFMQLKEKLAAEGLFHDDEKQPLPEFPMRIGIITSATGAVIHDMLRVIRRKNTLASVLLHPVKVQGEGAADEIATAIATLNQPEFNLDVLIVARGGGSFEDLFCFSEEAVVRAIFASQIPVVTGIGHEPDFSLADAVADFSCSTPTAAAEHVVPDIEQIQGYLAYYHESLVAGLEQKILFYEQLLDSKAETFIQQSHRLLDQGEANLTILSEQLQNGLRAELNRWEQYLEQQPSRLITFIEQRYQQSEASLAQLAAELDAFSPLKTLARGYAIVSNTQGNVITETTQAQLNSEISIQLTDGHLNCQVNSIHPNPKQEPHHEQSE